MKRNSERTLRVFFATIAIGIGVNIADIRHVIHIGVPKTMEAYYQEIGRAGRDGKAANATLFYNGHDISANTPGMTQEMRDFCLDESSCLRRKLMTYLGFCSQTIFQENHLCCSNCLTLCQCNSCKT